MSLFELQISLYFTFIDKQIQSKDWLHYFVTKITIFDKFQLIISLFLLILPSIDRKRSNAHKNINTFK
jgi:hypothetical protein